MSRWTCRTREEGGDAVGARTLLAWILCSVLWRVITAKWYQRYCEFASMRSDRRQTFLRLPANESRSCRSADAWAWRK